jgi:hypothetical protein
MFIRAKGGGQAAIGILVVLSESRLRRSSSGPGSCPGDGVDKNRREFRGVVSPAVVVPYGDVPYVKPPQLVPLSPLTLISGAGCGGRGSGISEPLALLSSITESSGRSLDPDFRVGVEGWECRWLDEDIGEGDSGETGDEDDGWASIHVGGDADPGKYAPLLLAIHIDTSGALASGIPITGDGEGELEAVMESGGRMENIWSSAGGGP